MKLRPGSDRSAPGGRTTRRRSLDGAARQHGLVSAEFAVAIVAALGLLVALLAGVQLVVLQIRCIDVAAQVARQAARNDEAATRQAKAAAPDGASVVVERDDQAVRVTVSLHARPLAAVFPPVPLVASARVLSEPRPGA